MRPAARNLIALAGLGAYLVLILAVSLWPHTVDQDIGVVGWRVTGRLAEALDTTPQQAYRLIEFGANVLMYAPLGFFGLVLARRRRWWLVLGGGVLLSAAAELAQAVFRPARVASGTDVLANGLGVLVGLVAAAVMLTATLRRRRVRA